MGKFDDMFSRDMYFEIEDQGIDEYGKPREFVFARKGKLKSLRDAFASNFQEGERRDHFIQHWDHAVHAIDRGTIQSDRWVMAYSDDSDYVMIFKLYTHD